jgi:hypothetical protein
MHDDKTEFPTADSNGDAPRYHVFNGRQLDSGTAREILSRIQQGAAEDSELSGMNVDQYADGLIKDAAYFVPRPILEFLSAQDYVTRFDRALNYLSMMQSSQVRILSREPMAAATSA